MDPSDDETAGVASIVQHSWLGAYPAAVAASPWDFRSSLLRGRGLFGDLELSITTLQTSEVTVT